MRILGKSETYALITDGENVFTSTLPITKDENDIPQGLRWECSISHYENYKEVYKWAV